MGRLVSEKLINDGHQVNIFDLPQANYEGFDNSRTKIFKGNLNDSSIEESIMGVDTVIPSKKFRLGFLFQKPNSYYPLHSHSAAETYFIVGGELDWSDGNKTRKLVAGDTINHSSLLPHSFETKSAGFLGLWHWSELIGEES